MALPITRPRLRECAILFCTLAVLLPLSSALPLHSAAVVTCGAANFKTVALFFLANYIAHAAIALSPAEGSFVVSAFLSLLSLLYPFVGLLRSITLAHAHLLAKDNLGKALSQGAVVVAARTPD